MLRSHPSIHRLPLTVAVTPLVVEPVLVPVEVHSTSDAVLVVTTGLPGPHVNPAMTTTTSMWSVW